MLDLDPLQMLGQLLTAVLVTRSSRREPLARLIFDARRVERRIDNLLPEQEELPRVEPLRAGAVVASQNRGDRRLHRFIYGGLLLRLESCNLGRRLLVKLDDHPLQGINIVRQFIEQASCFPL